VRHARLLRLALAGLICLPMLARIARTAYHITESRERYANPSEHRTRQVPAASSPVRSLLCGPLRNTPSQERTARRR